MRAPVGPDFGEGVGRYIVQCDEINYFLNKIGLNVLENIRIILSNILALQDLFCVCFIDSLFQAFILVILFSSLFVQIFFYKLWSPWI